MNMYNVGRLAKIIRNFQARLFVTIVDLSNRIQIHWISVAT